MLGEIEYLLETRQPINEELRLDILDRFDDWPGQPKIINNFIFLSYDRVPHIQGSCASLTGEFFISGPFIRRCKEIMRVKSGYFCGQLMNRCICRNYFHFALGSA